MSYTWDLKESNIKQVKYCLKELNLVIDRCIEIGYLASAVKQLKFEGLINIDISDRTYIEQCKTKLKYKKWRTKKNQEYQSLKQEVIHLHNKGLNYIQISNIVGKTKQYVWNLINRNK
jgi:hypothetical protein